MIRPQSLQPGDRVALVAPARFVESGQLAGFTGLLEEVWGLIPDLDPALFERHHQFAGTDKERLDVLQRALNDPGIRAVFCCRGGYGSLRLLEGIDFTKFRDDPSWVVGFSDVTALHACLVHEGFESVHAMMPFTYNRDTQAGDRSAASLYKALFLDPEPIEFPGHSLNIAGTAEGGLIGGNLSMLFALQGSPWQYDPGGRILFLEDVDEYLYHIDRMMMNLHLSGFLGRIKGMVVGTMSGMKDNEVPFGTDAYGIISGVAGRYGFPVAFGLPAGHSDPNLALVLGRRVRLEVGPGASRLEYCLQES